jgi:hypothetical protein
VSVAPEPQGRAVRAIKPQRSAADGSDVPRRSSKTPEVREQRVLYQDARWPLRGRLLFGFLYPVLLAAVVGSLLKGNSVGTEVIVVAVFSVPIVACEWRARRMGFTITPEGIELIRALNRTFVPWDRVDRFVLRKTPGAVDHGQRTVWIQRSKGGLLPLPTLYVTPSSSRWFSWMGPAGLKWNGGRTDDTIAFLDQALGEHQANDAPVRAAT